MSNINKIIQSSPCRLSAKQREQAISIDTQLQQGQPYLHLNGCKLRASKAYIRFKLGYNIRLLYLYNGKSYEPLTIIPRKALEGWIKRR